MARRQSCSPRAAAREIGRWVTDALPKPRKLSDLRLRSWRRNSWSERTLKSRKRGSTATEFAACTIMPNIRSCDGRFLQFDELGLGFSVVDRSAVQSYNFAPKFFGLPCHAAHFEAAPSHPPKLGLVEPRDAFARPWVLAHTAGDDDAYRKC